MENNSERNVDRWVDDQLRKLAPDGEWHPNVTRALSAFREQSANVQTNRQKWTWGAVAVVVAVSSLLAFPGSRVLAQRCIAACQNLLFPDSNTVELATVSGIAPDFTLKDAQGADLRLMAYRGKVVLLNFWASWCPPCETEIPWFVEFQRAYASQGFEVIGVAMDESGWTSVRPYMSSLNVNYPVVLGDEDLAKQYGAYNLPITVLIDRQGRIADKHLGIVSKSDYEGKIVQLLGK